MRPSRPRKSHRRMAIHTRRMDHLREMDLPLIIRTIQDADRALEYYHYFHDAFVKVFTIKANDILEDESAVADGNNLPPSQAVTGLFDVMMHLQLVWSDSMAEAGGMKNVVLATFFDVKDLCLDLRVPVGNFTSWNLMGLSISEARRHCEADDRPPFVLIAEWNWLKKDEPWSTRRTELFCFEHAEFEG